MRRTAFMIVTTIAIGGCGDPSPLPMAATLETARPALVAALDGWKQGLTYQELMDRSPSLYFRDDDLNRSLQLLDYSIEGDGQPNGTGFSFVVSLNIQDREGARPPVRKRVAYTVVTRPKTAISREDRNP